MNIPFLIILPLAMALFMSGATAWAADQTGSKIHALAVQSPSPVELKNGMPPKNSHAARANESTSSPHQRKAEQKPLKKAAEKPSKKAKVEKPKAETRGKEPQITVTKKNPEPSRKNQRPSPKPIDADEFDEYGNTPTIADPIEPVNRGLFWVNHQLYTFVLRPVSKVYTTVIPKPVRNVVHNVYENVEYPVRAVNHVLQGKFDRADLETRKFVVNTVGGLGGIIKLSDRFPSLADIPSADTGQTFAKWGIGHGPYIVLPVIGPRSARDTVGMAGDYALNPISWLPFGPIAEGASLAISAPNGVRNLNNRMEVYDASTKDAIDPYIAVRSGYVQYRDNAAKK